MDKGPPIRRAFSLGRFPGVRRPSGHLAWGSWRGLACAEFWSVPRKVFDGQERSPRRGFVAATEALFDLLAENPGVERVAVFEAAGVHAHRERGGQGKQGRRDAKGNKVL